MATLLDLALISKDIYRTYQPSSAGACLINARGDSSLRRYRRLAEASIMKHSSGFHGAIYEYGDDLIIACRGTDPSSGRDLAADLRIGRGKIPDQFHPAMQLFNQASCFRPLENIIITGHSLGGGLTQLVSAATGALGITFNAPGMATQVFLGDSNGSWSAKVLNMQRHKQRFLRAFGADAQPVINIVLEMDPVSSFGGLIGHTIRLPLRTSDALPPETEGLNLRESTRVAAQAHGIDAVIESLRRSGYGDRETDWLLHDIRAAA